MNFFEQELRKLAAVCDELVNPVFAGRFCYGELSEKNRVKLQFVTMGYAEQYEALEAEILNTSDGKVDAVYFRFEDIWGKKQVKNPNFPNGIIPTIWTSNGKSAWYVYNPTVTDLKKLAETVGGYIQVFKSASIAAEKEKKSVLREVQDSTKRASVKKMKLTNKKTKQEHGKEAER